MLVDERPQAISATTAWWIVGAITLFGAALRFYHLNSGLWFDEIVTLIEAVRAPLGEIVTSLSGDNDHPLYSLLAHFSIEAFGEKPWSLRLPAALAGIATIPVLYVFGARVSGRAEALAAAALLTVSYHHVWFSQNARGYTLLLLLTLVSTHLLLRALENGRAGGYLLYGFTAALGCYAHLTMVFIVLGQALVVGADLLLDPLRRGRISNYLNPALGFGLAGLLTLLLYAPLIADIQPAIEPDPPPPVAGEGRVATGVVWFLLELLRQLDIGFALSALGVLGMLLFVAGSASFLIERRMLLALAFVPAGLIAIAVLVLDHPTRPRLFFFLSGFVLLIVARGAIVLGRWLVERTSIGLTQHAVSSALLVTLGVVSVLALPSAYRFPKQDYEGALDYLREAADDAPVAVAGIGAALPYQRYYRLPWQELERGNELEALLRGHERVWLVHTLSSYIPVFKPDLWRAIESSCSVQRTFPGTVGDGNISVRLCSSS